MSEADVKKELKKYLKNIGAYWFMPVQMGYGASSIDFLVCYRGRFYGIETKRPGKLPTARQGAIMNAIQTAGGKAWVENSENLERTRAVLSNGGNDIGEKPTPEYFMSLALHPGRARETGSATYRAVRLNKFRSEDDEG